jgi:hypothetical protein
VVNAGASLLFLNFQYNNMPVPGDSGSPILQAGKVIGLMSSITLNCCMGTAVNIAQLFKSGILLSEFNKDSKKGYNKFMW